MTRTEYDVVALGELLIDFTAQGALIKKSMSKSIFPFLSYST